MMQYQVLSPDQLVAEVNYRRERLLDGRIPGQARARRVHFRRHRARSAA